MMGVPSQVHTLDTKNYSLQTNLLEKNKLPRMKSSSQTVLQQCGKLGHQIFLSKHILSIYLSLVLTSALLGGYKMQKNLV